MVSFMVHPLYILLFYRLQYQYILFACVHNGRHKKGCPMGITFKATEDGQSLRIKATNLAHNHELSQAEFEADPRNKKWVEMKKKIVSGLSMILAG